MTRAPHRLPIAELAPLIERRDVTAVALVEACLGEVARANGELNAFITVLVDEARAQARDADREIAAGRYRGPLHGVPISVKDLIDIKDVTTTAASRVRIGHRALRDARVIARLRAAGAVFVGKTNLHEFAFGVTNEDSAFGPARNPHDPSRSPGGSSGGSAAAIAAGMSVASIGTDTGGSIRIPAAACGIVGLKPHTGAVSCAGVVPLSPTMDHVGPMARTAADARLLFTAMAGRAPAARRTPAQPVRLGVPRRYFLDRLDTDVRRRFDDTLDRLRAAGVRIDGVEIPHADDIVPIYLHISLAEAARYHAPALSRTPEEYTRPVRLRLELGRYVLAEDYLRALEGRRALRAEVDAALAGRHGLVLPTLPIPAPPLFASTVEIDGRPEPVRAALLRLTQLFNMTGHPAISIPCGTTPAGLPCGCQLVGPHADTAGLLDLAEALEPHIVPGDPAGGD
jgi:aspartyl-tRNA(Asn)/glutamyl-tRNA(Gln) amidotransferase subunit A